MDIERKCLKCWFCAEDTAQTQQPQLIGHRVYMCLANPPSNSAIPAQGGLAMVAAYPNVTDKSVSCARWTPQPPAEVRRLVRKGTNTEGASNGNE